MKNRSVRSPERRSSRNSLCSLSRLGSAGGHALAADQRLFVAMTLKRGKYRMTSPRRSARRVVGEVVPGDRFVIFEVSRSRCAEIPAAARYCPGRSRTRVGRPHRRATRRPGPTFPGTPGTRRYPRIGTWSSRRPLGGYVHDRHSQSRVADHFEFVASVYEVVTLGFH